MNVHKAGIKKIAATAIIPLAILLSSCSSDDDQTAKGILDIDGQKDPYLVQYLVPGSDFLSIHGITFDADDNLYVGSVMGQGIYKVDIDTGESEVFVAPPRGMADDLEFGPDGTLVWTSILTGEVYARRPDGEIVVLADKLPGANAVAFSEDGRLFVTQVLWGDALWELDVKGKKPPRQVASDLGHLNGFDFDSKGYIYGPLMYKSKVVRVDPDSGEITDLAGGFRLPVAVNIDSQDNLYVPDTARGRILRIDLDTGEKTLLATVDEGTDNLAINSKDELFITNMIDNGIYKINTRTGASRTIVKSELSVPGGLDVVTGEDGSDQVHLANLFAYSSVNGDTGAVTHIKRALRDKMEMPQTITIQGDRVTTSSWFTGSVEVIDLHSGESLAAYHNFKLPVDALALDETTLLVAEQGTGNLLRVSGEHGEDREVVAEDLAGMVAMRPHPKLKNEVYLTDTLRGQLLRVNIRNGKKKVVTEGLSDPEGFDVAPDGTIVLAEVGKNRIVRIKPDTGTIEEVIASNLAIGYPAVKGMPPGHIMTGVGVSDNGAIYVSSDTNTALYKITPQK